MNFHGPHMIRRDISVDPTASLAELAQAVGANSVRREYYTFNIDFTGQDIAASGGQQSQSQQVDAAGSFVVTRFNAAFWIVATLGSAVAGSPLPMESDPDSGSNEMPSMAMLTVLFSTNSWQWSNTPQRMSLACGTARFPNWVQVCPVIPANDTITATVTNNAAVAVRGQIGLYGYRIIRQS